MSGRSVAEIIGKGSPTYLISDVNGKRVRERRGWRCTEPVTVDDMLAWLHPDRAFIDSIEPETGLTPGADPADRWCIHVLYGDDQGDLFTAPTLLAALEAVVRAVAGEDEQ